MKRGMADQAVVKTSIYEGCTKKRESEFRWLKQVRERKVNNWKGKRDLHTEIPGKKGYIIRRRSRRQTLAPFSSSLTCFLFGKRENLQM